ncbi:hypothetical protein C7S15_7904 [Burkholderia cepacia]|nr:hypothetical protein [Burkholderia cepacia]
MAATGIVIRYRSRRTFHPHAWPARSGTPPNIRLGREKMASAMFSIEN